MKGEGHAVLDIVPVDVVINVLVSSAWYTGINKRTDTKIYHCTTGGLHPFRWSEMGKNF
jgi:fatty acyl-CoA reductase